MKNLQYILCRNREICAAASEKKMCRPKEIPDRICQDDCHARPGRQAIIFNMFFLVILVPSIQQIESKVVESNFRSSLKFALFACSAC